MTSPTEGGVVLAKATRNVTDIMDYKPVKVGETVTVTLELTKEEAETLRMLVGHVWPNSSKRYGHAQSIWKALRVNAGVAYPDDGDVLIEYPRFGPRE